MITKVFSVDFSIFHPGSSGPVMLNKASALPMRRAATMNVGAGQYQSSNVAMTMLPIMPPSRAATIEIATPVALELK